MTRNDILILSTLEKKRCINPVQALTIRGICEIVKLSNAKVRSTVKSLILIDLVSTGFNNGNAATFYITPKGISFLKEVNDSVEGKNRVYRNGAVWG